MSTGDIRVQIGLDTRPFEQGARRAMTETQTMSRGVTREFSGMSGQMRSQLSQVSFAFDDFFGVLQNSGNVGAALRATSNNIGTLVTAINPLAGIATTLALAFGSTLVTAFTGAKEEASSLSDELKNLSDNVDAYFDVRKRASEIRKGEFNSDDVKDTRLELEKLQTKRDLLGKREQALRDETREGGLLDIGAGILGGSADLYAMLLRGVPAGEARGEFAQKGEERREAGRQARFAAADGGEILRAQQETDRAIAVAEGQLKEMERQQADALKAATEFAKNLTLGTVFGSTSMPLEERRRVEKEREAADKRAQSERERQEREKERERKEQERIQQEQQRRADQFDDIGKDLQSTLLSGDEQRRFDINRRYDEQRQRIFDTAPSLGEAFALSGTNEQARQRELARVGQGEGQQFAGVNQRGSASAFSEILRASGVAADKKKEEKEIAKTNAEIAKQTAAMALAFQNAQPLAIIGGLL